MWTDAAENFSMDNTNVIYSHALDATGMGPDYPRETWGNPRVKGWNTTGFWRRHTYPTLYPSSPSPLLPSSPPTSPTFAKPRKFVQISRNCCMQRIFVPRLFPFPPRGGQGKEPGCENVCDVELGMGASGVDGGLGEIGIKSVYGPRPYPPLRCSWPWP